MSIDKGNNKQFCIDIKKTISIHYFAKNVGLSRDLNPGPLSPKARIIPLDY